MNNALVRVGANVVQFAGGALVVVAGWELRHWLGLALAGALLILAGAAIEREVT